jgi:hypothetical protein
MSSIIKIYSFPDGEELFVSDSGFTIGRVSGNDLVLPDESISRNHAEIIPLGEDWAIRDLGSTNGSMLNGELLLSDQIFLLRGNDKVSFGSFIVLIKEEEVSRKSPSLIIFRNNQYEGSFVIGKGTTFSYGGPQATIECEDGCDLVFFVRQDEDSVTLMPRAISGGLLLNNNQVTHKTILEDRDVLKLFDHLLYASIPKNSPDNKNLPEKEAQMPDYLKSRIGADNWNDPLDLKRKSAQTMMMDSASYEDSGVAKATNRFSVSELGAQRFSTPSLEAVKLKEVEENKKYALIGVITLVILIGMASVIFNLYLRVIF